MNLLTVDLGDYQLEVFREGSGRPLLLIHGSVSDRRTWEKHVKSLSSSFDVVAPSLRYFGTKQWPDDGGDFGSTIHAADITSLIKKLELKDVLCVGWSYGGNVALHSAVMNPSPFKQLILYEPAVASLISDDSAREQATTDRIKMFERTAKLLATVEPKQAIETFLDDVVGEKGIYQSMPEYVKQISMENASMLSLLFNMVPAAIDLDKLNVPTVLACGEGTRDFYKITARCLGQQCPSIDVQYIPNANHVWPVLDVDAFCSLLTEISP